MKCNFSETNSKHLKERKLMQAYYQHVTDHKKEAAEKQMATAKVQHWLQQEDAVIDVGQYQSPATTCTESVNFLGLEVFLAPSTAWAACNQPRTPKN